MIIGTCFGEDSKEQNALQNSDVQWSGLLFYKEIRRVWGYVSCAVLNHYILPRAQSWLFILELVLLFFGSFLWSQKALRSIAHCSRKQSTMRTACAGDTTVK